MFDQILSTSTIRSIWRTARRTCMLILGLKGITLSLQSQILGLWLKSFSVAIHVEATEQLFHVVLFAMLYDLVPILGAVDEIIHTL